MILEAAVDQVYIENKTIKTKRQSVSPEPENKRLNNLTTHPEAVGNQYP